MNFKCPICTFECEFAFEMHEHLQETLGEVHKKLAKQAENAGSDGYSDAIDAWVHNNCTSQLTKQPSKEEQLL